MLRAGPTRWLCRRTQGRVAVPDALGLGDPVLGDLAQRVPTRKRIALVVAHPDDETIAAGASLHLLTGLLLVHVTDGAPRTLGDAARAGFATSTGYAATRRAELRAALTLAGCSPVAVELGVPDQDASLHMPVIAQDLARLFAQHEIGAVITHAYEGGHPDHDATALATHLAAPGLAASGGIIEFPGYYASPDGAFTTGRFLPGPRATTVALTLAEQARKRAMFACFRTQAAVLAAFGAATEAFRPAHPDFRHPPHPGALNYERWGWEMTGARWRALAAPLLPGMAKSSLADPALANPALTNMEPPCAA